MKGMKNVLFHGLQSKVGISKGKITEPEDRSVGSGQRETQEERK